MLNRGLLISALVCALALVGMGAFYTHAKGQRDTARAQLAGANAALATARLDTKAATDAAARCLAEFDDADARCKAALAASSATAERQRKALRACQSDDGVAARLGGVTR